MLNFYNASESIVTPNDDTERAPLIDTTVDLQVGDQEPLEILKATPFVESWLRHCSEVLCQRTDC